jgi:hypothetical protein
LGVEVEMLRTRFTLVREIGEHARGPVHSVLRMWEERRKETLEGAAARPRGSSSSGVRCSAPDTRYRLSPPSHLRARILTVSR